MSHKRLVVNADDFGLSPEINLGIIRAHVEGVVTSASVMTGGDAFDDAVALSKNHPRLGIGLHLTLVDTRPTAPASAVPSLVAADGHLWTITQLLSRLHLGLISRDHVAVELDAQFGRALSCGLQLTHLDGHKHLHVHPFVLPTVIAVAQRHRLNMIRLPVAQQSTASLRAMAVSAASRMARRRLTVAGLRWADRFHGLAETGALSASAFARILRSIGPGLSEVMCHPGYAGDLRPHTGRLHRQRELELQTLMDREIRDLVRNLNIELIHYGHA